VTLLKPAEYALATGELHGYMNSVEILKRKKTFGPVLKNCKTQASY
jgi:hypothetical protein